MGKVYFQDVIYFLLILMNNIQSLFWWNFRIEVNLRKLELFLAIPEYVSEPIIKRFKSRFMQIGWKLIRLNPNEVFNINKTECIWSRVDRNWIFNPN